MENKNNNRSKQRQQQQKQEQQQKQTTTTTTTSGKTESKRKNLGLLVEEAMANNNNDKSKQQQQQQQKQQQVAKQRAKGKTWGFWLKKRCLIWASLGVRELNSSRSNRSFLSICQLCQLLAVKKILFIKLSNFLFFGARLCFLCDIGSIIKDHSSLSYLCQFQVIDDESWFGPKVHCGDRMLGNLILRRIMRLKVGRYEDNESRTFDTLKEMVVTLIGADGDC